LSSIAQGLATVKTVLPDLDDAMIEGSIDMLKEMISGLAVLI
jgi:hypothetical protein